jgi:hypothetical protein
VSTLFEEIENQWVVSDSLDIRLSEEKSIVNDDDEDYHPPSELDVPAQVAAEPVDTTPEHLSNNKSKIPPMGKPCGPKCKRQCTQNISEVRRKELWENNGRLIIRRRGHGSSTWWHSNLRTFLQLVLTVDAAGRFCTIF